MRKDNMRQIPGPKPAVPPSRPLSKWPHSRVLDTADRGTTDLGPVDTVVYGLIDKADQTDIVATHNVEAQNSLLAGVRVF